MIAFYICVSPVSIELGENGYIFCGADLEFELKS